MFYDVDFLMKAVDVVLKRNKYNPCIQPGYYEEARHRVAIVIEYIGAPMQMVLPKCETALKVYDTAAFCRCLQIPTAQCQASETDEPVSQVFRQKS